MKKIDGSPKSLKQLLQNTKYSIHYYQREYMWQRKHIEELIDDLTSEFLEYYKPGDSRPAVADYGAYFMGSIVLAGRENAIIDGQQRFSSLTLLLMYLNNRLKVIGQSYNMIETMIFSESFGTKSFNINVEDRQECMEAIFLGKEYDITNANESVRNLYSRYHDIIDIFPTDINDDILLHFCDWLAEKVFFIEIVATTEQDAHKVFVTMNDRGLSLTSTEMLKGYLLSEIKSDSIREKMNDLWKDRVLALKKDDDKGDETFIKAWLRAHYAETIRDTKAGAVNKDFDIIGGSFHKWVRDERDKLGLNSSDDFELFIKKFSKFSEIYQRIRQAETVFAEETKYVYYNAQVNFTLQPQLLLAPVCFDDPWPVIIEKINLVAGFIDILIISRVSNYRSVDYCKCVMHKGDDNEFITSKMMDSNLLNARNAYRSAHDMLTSEDIKSIRRRYGLTQRELAKMLGWGEATITRYETKLIQDDAHDAILKSINIDAYEAKQYLERNKENFEESRYLAINMAIEHEIACSSRTVYTTKLLDARYTEFQSNQLLTGSRSLDIPKVCNMASFFAKHCADLFKVKLMKLLWYADALHFKEHGLSMSGLVYQHMPMGALPVGHHEFMSLIPYEEQYNGFEFVSYKILPCESFNEEVFSPGELNILYRVVRKFSSFSGNDLANYMHQEEAYKQTEEYAYIPYDLSARINI